MGGVGTWSRGASVDDQRRSHEMDTRARERGGKGAVRTMRKKRTGGRVDHTRRGRVEQEEDAEGQRGVDGRKMGKEPRFVLRFTVDVTLRSAQLSCGFVSAAMRGMSRRRTRRPFLTTRRPPLPQLPSAPVSPPSPPHLVLPSPSHARLSSSIERGRETTPPCDDGSCTRSFPPLGSTHVHVAIIPRSFDVPSRFA